MADDDFEDQDTPGRPKPTPRPYRMSDSERERHRRNWGARAPVPVVAEPADDITAPIELLLNGELTTEDHRQVETLRRSVTGERDVIAMVMNLAKAIARHREKDRSGSQEIQQRVTQAIEQTLRMLTALDGRVAKCESDGPVAGRRIDDLNARIIELDSAIDCDDKDRPGLRQEVHQLRPLGAFAKWALGIAGGAALAIGIFLYTRGVSEGTDREQLRRALRDIDEMHEDLRALQKQLKGTP